MKKAGWISVVIPFTISLLCGGFAEAGRGFNRSTQDEGNSKDRPPIIEDNTVVFLAISQADFDSLVAQKPEMSIMIEELEDYYHYANMVASRLIPLGYKVILGSWPEITVQMGKGKVKKISFKPEDRKAILMKAKGEEPKLVKGFSSDYGSIAKIISDYFHIDLSIRE